MASSGNSTATLVNHLEYNAFGTITSQTNSAYQPLQTYTGQIQDTATGLLYYDARWYDPGVAQFVSEDPIGFAAGDANLRRYVGNSMPNAVDPTGLIDPTVSLPWNPVPTHVRQHQNRVDNYGSVNGVSRALVSTATVGFKNDFDVVKPPDEIATDKSYTFTVLAMQGVTELGIGLGAGKLATAPGRLGKAAFAYDAVQNTSNFGQGVYRGNKLQAGLGVVGITGNVSGLASRARRLEDLTQAATVDARTVDAVTGPNNANAVDKLCVEGQIDEGLEWVSAPNSGTQSIFKAPQPGKGQRLLNQGFHPEDFPSGGPYADGKAYFAKERGLAEQYSGYGEGILEVEIPKSVYDARIKPHEVPYLSDPRFTEIPIPPSEFDVLNNALRRLHDK